MCNCNKRHKRAITSINTTEAQRLAAGQTAAISNANYAGDVEVLAQAPASETVQTTPNVSSENDALVVRKSRTRKSTTKSE